MSEPETLTITIGAGEEAPRALTLRRPTHGELDLGMLQRLMQVVVGYQGRIAAIEAAPEAGSVEKIANLVGLADEGVQKVRERVRRFLERCASPDAVQWLDAGGLEAVSVERAFAVAVAAILELAPPARLPKSALS